jgi:hypothetical protein
VKDIRTSCHFEVTRAAAAQAIASISRSEDIVMITEPPTPAALATQQFAWLLSAAFQSAAAVMLVPTRVARATGPVVAIALAPDDPSILTAAAIAVAAKENLIIVHRYEGKGDDPKDRKLAADTGLTIKHVFTGKASLSDPTTYAHINVRERLVVAARGVLAPESALAIASSRRVPVLLIAPGEASPRPR